MDKRSKHVFATLFLLLSHEQTIHALKSTSISFLTGSTLPTFVVPMRKKNNAQTDQKNVDRRHMLVARTDAFSLLDATSFSSKMCWVRYPTRGAPNNELDVFSSKTQPAAGCNFVCQSGMLNSACRVYNK